MHPNELALRNDAIAPRARPATSSIASAPLSPREQEVLALLARGLSYQECANVLGVGRETVKTLVKRTLRKLDASCAREAIAIALRDGTVT